MPAPTAEALKQRHRTLRDKQETNASTRLHRAISWLARAERESEDLDARFIFQWVALNAAYAREVEQNENERQRFRDFIDKLVELDKEAILHHALFRQFSGSIRTLINNKYVFGRFWDALRTHDPTNQWEVSFDGAKRVSLDAIMRGDTATLLSVVFDRLYVLRNQLIHGGATWNSGVNREQLRDAVAILGTIVPLVISIMLDHPQHDFGEVLYPVV